MGINKFWVWLVIMLLNERSSWYCLGCLEEERIALKDLKANIKFPPGNWLPSWDDINGTASDCCQWQGVQCSNTTSRVTELDLNFDYNYYRKGDWYINASLFLPFQELRNISLSNNGLLGWIENEGFDRLSKLKNLEALDLSWNSFDRNLLTSLSQLSSLKNLNLDDSFGLRGKTNSHERLSGLKKLQVLHFSSRYYSINDTEVLSVLALNDFINLKELDISCNQFQSLRTIYGLRNLKVLNLGENGFNNNIFSSLQGLSSLESLDLSSNDIKGSVQINGLRNLKVLNLGSNGFNNNIFSSLQGLSSLESLDLSWNDIKGSVQINELHALNNLVELDLSFNEVDNFNTSKDMKTMPSLQVLRLDEIAVSNISNMLQSLRAFPYLKNLYFECNIDMEGPIGTYDLKHLNHLEGLSLSGSSLDENFLKVIGVMTSLKFLSLQGCGLNGTLPNQGWCELKNLEELDLSRNEYEGILPSCLGNMTSLRLIELSWNNFSGNIALSPLTKLTSLESLSLSSNNFQVPVSFESFFNHSNLRFIIVGNNNVITEIESRNSVPSFQLEVFSLSYCHLATLPKFLHYQTDLRILDLSYDNIGGNFPNRLLERNKRLRGLYLIENAFTGTLKLPTSTNSVMEEFDISSNKLNGHIPSNMGSTFPNLRQLNMSKNAFHGLIPSSIGALKFLRSLDLSKNKMRGQIFPESTNLQNLGFILLNDNEFSGTISNSFSTMPYLTVLDISNNNLTGRIPTSVGIITQLTQVSVSNNHLEGPIPVEICKLENLELLDLSENNLFGSIPSCFNQLDGIAHVNLNNNQLEGRLTNAFFNISSLVTLDLRENQFIGSIPQAIGNMSSLSIILLGRNHFEGAIPDTLCQMNRLSMIDLSYNGLYGQIPHCLGNITLEVTEKKSRLYVLAPFMDYLRSVAQERGYITLHEKGVLGVENGDIVVETELEKEIIVTFTTKGNSLSYKGTVLLYMTGIDLSSNKLDGEIPIELGKLSELHALNLSHNYLNGAIPATFSNISQLESLDLSFNNLSGRIPTGLVELKSLAVFSVAHNNLTGIIPPRKDQFGTFDKDSYEGNPYLCGPPLPVDCTGSKPVLPTDESEESIGFMDMEFFYISFTISYVSVVLCIATVLYINPHWRRAWFHLIEVYII